MAVLKEFREFAVKGNVVDLAVGIIIGGAFGKIVDSLVNDIVMPVISSLLGGKIDFTNLFIVLGNVPDGIPRTFDALKKPVSRFLPMAISLRSRLTSFCWPLLSSKWSKWSIASALPRRRPQQSRRKTSFFCVKSVTACRIKKVTYLNAFI
ncbi:MAG: hypothetical protein RIQ35_46 [Pseudomonadota bacterium]|jgi:large conductance mechanosensitive channel protein